MDESDEAQALAAELRLRTVERDRMATALVNALERLEASQPASGSATDEVCCEARVALKPVGTRSQPIGMREIIGELVAVLVAIQDRDRNAAETRLRALLRRIDLERQ